MCLCVGPERPSDGQSFGDTGGALAYCQGLAGSLPTSEPKDYEESSEAIYAFLDDTIKWLPNHPNCHHGTPSRELSHLPAPHYQIHSPRGANLGQSTCKGAAVLAGAS